MKITKARLIVWCVVFIMIGIAATVVICRFQNDKMIKYNRFLVNQYKIDERTIRQLTLQERWFNGGYIEKYSPGRYLFNGVAVTRRPYVASHPFLPIGTVLFVKNLTTNTSTIVPVLDRKYVMGSRIILSISEDVAEVLDWHSNDRFSIQIIGLPPAFDENFWYDYRLKEKELMDGTKRYRRRRLLW